MKTPEEIADRVMDGAPAKRLGVAALAQFAGAHASDWSATPPEIVQLIGRVVLEVAKLRAGELA